MLTESVVFMCSWCMWIGDRAWVPTRCEKAQTRRASIRPVTLRRIDSFGLFVDSQPSPRLFQAKGLHEHAHRHGDIHTNLQFSSFT